MQKKIIKSKCHKEIIIKGDNQIFATRTHTPIQIN